MLYRTKNDTGIVFNFGGKTRWSKPFYLNGF